MRVLPPERDRLRVDLPAQGRGPEAEARRCLLLTSFPAPLGAAGPRTGKPGTRRGLRTGLLSPGYAPSFFFRRSAKSASHSFLGSHFLPPL